MRIAIAAVVSLSITGCSAWQGISANVSGTYMNSCMKDNNTLDECKQMEWDAVKRGGGGVYVTKAAKLGMKRDARRRTAYRLLAWENEAKLCASGRIYFCD